MKKHIILIIFGLSFLFVGYNKTISPKKIIKEQVLTMDQYSCGRFDFNVPKQFKVVGRSHKIYGVDIETVPLDGKEFLDIWNKRIEEVRSLHLKRNYPIESFESREIDSSTHIVFYKKNTILPHNVTTELFKQIDESNFLKMTLNSAKENKKKKVLRLFSIIDSSYCNGSDKGFNIGVGSLVSSTSVNESAYIGFQDIKNNLDIYIRVHTVGKYLEKARFDNMPWWTTILGIKYEGVKIKVNGRRRKKALGFSGRKGRITMTESATNKKDFSHSWFYPGETANPFKPEISIELHGTTNNEKLASQVLSQILNSLKIRQE